MNNWYDDIDVATLQRIKTYSAFCDYKSQNLMLQTLYEAMQKKIDEYKKTNREIAKDFAALRKQVPQWHDLRKDPNDLPPNEHEVYVAVVNETARGRELIYGFDRYLTDSECWFIESSQKVIAWCETPKFEEK